MSTTQRMKGGRYHDEPTVATIGVYGFTADTFLTTLRKAKVKVVLDVRQRRGVRGAEYSWANAVRLQAALADANIEYRHVRDLAPTTAMREMQYRDDEQQGVGRRSRVRLASEYAREYTTKVLDPFDLDIVLDALPATGIAALLCVERDAEACHRSLVADRLAKEHGVTIEHLRPSDA
jgi:uncharacterized protein (DUF488 family)